MSKVNYVHKFCYFSKTRNSEVGYSVGKELFFEKNTGGEKRLTIKNDSKKFRESYCNGCDIFHTKEELKEEVQKRSIIPTLFNIIEVQKGLGWCLSYDEDIQLCPKGNKYESHQEYIINVNPYIWVWEAKVKGSKAIKLYTGEVAGEVLRVKPYHIPNVYEDGAACWGKQNPNPTDLRSAEEFFWQSSFNESITKVNTTLEEEFQRMNALAVFQNDPTVEYPIILSSRAHGAFFSNNPKFTEKFPSELLDGEWAHGWVYEIDSKLSLLEIQNNYFLKEGSLKTLSSLTYLGNKDSLKAILG